MLAIFAGLLCYYLGALANFYAQPSSRQRERPLLLSHFRRAQQRS